jgi:hypothetical protein
VIAQRRAASPASGDTLAGVPVVDLDAVHRDHGEDPPHPEPQLLRGKAGQRAPEGRGLESAMPATEAAELERLAEQLGGWPTALPARPT